MTSTPQTPRRYRPIWQLTSARLREFLREPEAVFWVYGFPVLMMISLGIAFRNQPVEQVVVDIVDGPRAAAAGDALQNSTIPERFKAEVRPEDAARLRLRTGKVDLVVIAKPAADAASQAVRYEYLFDATRPQSVLARAAVDDQLQRAAGRTDPVQVELVSVDEPGGRYIDFLVPGLIGMGLMGNGLWGIGFVTVDMRIRKLLKRFVATPMKKSHFLMGVMFSRMIGMVPEVLVVLLFARYAFGVVNQGSILSLIVLILLGAVMFSGLGLLLASRAKTIESVSGLMNLAMVPMWILSGIFFSSDRFPDAAQPFIKALPLTPLIDSMRSVMLEGAPLTAQWPRLAIMLAWAVVSFTLAIRWFRWT